jgi:hypothetical protein
MRVTPSETRQGAFTDARIRHQIATGRIAT